MRYRYTVHYSVATYEGDLTVFADGDSEDEHIHALARKDLERRSGPWPFGAQSFRITNKERCNP